MAFSFATFYNGFGFYGTSFIIHMVIWTPMETSQLIRLFWIIHGSIATLNSVLCFTEAGCARFFMGPGPGSDSDSHPHLGNEP